MCENIKPDSYDKPKLVKQDNLKVITFGHGGWQCSLAGGQGKKCKQDDQVKKCKEGGLQAMYPPVCGERGVKLSG